MRLFRIPLAAVFLFGFWASPLASQEGAGEGGADPAEWIGMELPALLARFGAPRSVYAVRGVEEWQDDVVFVYDHGDFYVFKDRVWQVGLKSAYGVGAGDNRAAALLVLGERTEDRGEYLLCPLPGKSWPLALRCNLDEGGKVSILFVYRSDF
jgi:hypothetical protein